MPRTKKATVAAKKARKAASADADISDGIGSIEAGEQQLMMSDQQMNHPTGHETVDMNDPNTMHETDNTAAAKLENPQGELDINARISAIKDFVNDAVTGDGQPMVEGGESEDKVVLKNPVQYLNEIQKGAVYNLTGEDGEGMQKTYTMELDILEHKYNGTARSKKLAKVSAARVCLKEMFNTLCDDEAPPKISRKRGASENIDFGGGLPKKRKQTIPKNALMQLNEIKPGLEFLFVGQSGPTHSPQFSMSVEVNGQVYQGTGQSKKKAKLVAAEQALRSFVQFQNAPEALKAMGNTNYGTHDFTTDMCVGESDIHYSDFDNLQNDGVTGEEAATNGHSPTGMASKKAALLKEPMGNKNPIMVLNELRPGLKYEFVSEVGESHAKNFKMSVTLDGQVFEGSARNKKMAKGRAAIAALSKVYDLQIPASPEHMPVHIEGREMLPQHMADLVSQKILEKFGELTDDFTSNLAKRKVLAGVVMTTGLESEDAEVICVTTGTKCINGEYINTQGFALNDCHAEIVSRRCLVRFLYHKLLDHIFRGGTDAASIFEKCENEDKCQVKENIKFHLYISTAPCGDCRIFSPHESENSDRHPNRKTRGQLRTKIESGEGTIPVKNGSTIQTWDGVLQGERLLTMSCSDKIAKWNTMGVQGSLLSYFMKPVYLDSIILGSLYNGEHLARGVYGRYSQAEDIQQPYRLNMPYLSSISNPESRQPGKAPNFSVNWCIIDNTIEVINTMTGKTEGGDTSRLSKHAMFRLFNNLFDMAITTNQPNKVVPKLYSEAKSGALEYQSTKDNLYKAFQILNLGSWVKKPAEQDQFEISSN